MKSLNNI